MNVTSTCLVTTEPSNVSIVNNAAFLAFIMTLVNQLSVRMEERLTVSDISVVFSHHYSLFVCCELRLNLNDLKKRKFRSFCGGKCLE